MAINNEILDELTAQCMTPEDVEILYRQLLQRLINRSLEAERDAHLGCDKHERSEAGRPNRRNGKMTKTVKGTFGELAIETPRDRDASFAPRLVKKRQVRLAGREDKILALYVRGMTTRDIEEALVEHYGVDVSHALIAQVTDAVLDEVRGEKEVLGLWLTELHSRGVQDLYIACMDGLKGLPEAVSAVFPPDPCPAIWSAPACATSRRATAGRW